MRKCGTRSHRSRKQACGKRLTGLALWLPAALLSAALTIGAFVPAAFGANWEFCIATADAAFTTCEAEVEDDFWVCEGRTPAR